MDRFKTKQGLSIYQDLSKKSRQNLNQKNEGIIHQEKIFKCDICIKSFKTSGTLKNHIESIHEGKNSNVPLLHQFLQQKAP